MTAQELSTMVRFGKTPIIFLMNNKGYTAERLIHDGEFNDIQDWQYWRLPEIFGGVAGCEVRTEADLEEALQRATRHAGPGPLMIEVHLDPLDVSEAFARMSAGLRSR
jgi:indolepyruvate decarboxylase